MQSETESCPVATPGLESRLEAAISHAAHLLPAQGPINVFVHHNTLHAFEEQGFHEAVAEATNTFGCHPYLLEEEYREELAAERMRFSDVEATLKELTSAGEKSLAGGLTTRLELRRLMLRYPLYVAPAGELKWLVAESDALRKIRPEVDERSRIQWLQATQRWILRGFGAELE
ncbi:MAG: putative inorganic carbon transporter subunit DabA, partial [Planctomycetota bacterium]